MQMRYGVEQCGEDSDAESLRNSPFLTGRSYEFWGVACIHCDVGIVFKCQCFTFFRIQSEDRRTESRKGEFPIVLKRITHNWIYNFVNLCGFRESETFHLFDSFTLADCVGINFVVDTQNTKQKKSVKSLNFNLSHEKVDGSSAYVLGIKWKNINFSLEKKKYTTTSDPTT